MFTLPESEICDTCEHLYSQTDSLRRWEFCSRKCEAISAEETHEPVVFSRGRLLRIGYVDGERFTFLNSPSALVEQIARYPLDLFTFLQHPQLAGIRHSFYAEPDNLAVLPISTFDHWWSKQIDSKTRNMVRKAEKHGVEVRQVELSDSYLQGIHAIYNESPIRQGRRFPHYGISFDALRESMSTFPARSIYLGAYLGSELIGFARLATDFQGNLADTLSLLSLMKYRDKAPTNALIAEAVRVCDARGISQLGYAKFSYGKKEGGTLAEFKANNGFEKLEVPRYWVSLSVWGEAARRMGLHRRIQELVPESIASRLRDLRAISSSWLLSRESS